jgi:hypothetical protein
MRMMLKVGIPTEAGNKGIQDGSLPKLIESTMQALNAEAAYFIAQEGRRCALFFFDMRDSSEIPGIAEPLFSGFNLSLTTTHCPCSHGEILALSAAMGALLRSQEGARFIGNFHAEGRQRALCY